jgi:hypothetical protein
MKTLSAAFAASLALASSLLAAQTSTSAARKAIQAAYDEQSQAWIRQNPKALEAIFLKRTTNEYTSTTDGVKRSRKELIKGFSSAMDRAKKVHEYTIKIQSFKLIGNRANVATTGKIVADLADDEAVTHRLEMRQNVTSVWVKQGGAWKARSSVIKTTKMLIDGKEMPLPARGKK